MTHEEAFEEGRSLGMDHGEAAAYAKSKAEPKQALTPETIEVGDGVTMYVGSDCYAGTVTSVSKSGKTIGFTMDDYKATPDSDYYGEQKYTYTSVPVSEWVDPLGETHSNVRTARWSAKRSGFLTFGRSLGSGRSARQDPSF